MKHITWIVALMTLSLTACHDEEPSPPPPVASAPTPPTAPPLNPECSEVFMGNNSMMYDKTELNINISKCAEFTIVVRNVGHLPKNARGHNIVLSTQEDQDGILADGVNFGASQNFLKPNDPRIIAYTPLAGGGEEERITFSTRVFQNNKQYVYFCSFLGHQKMRGKVNIISDA